MKSIREYLKKHKRILSSIVICCLLGMCLIPLGCGGSSEAEPKSPPKTNYQLEDMIQEVKDMITSVKADITALQSKIKDVQSKDYGDEIDDILDEIADLWDAFVTPQPTSNGSHPTPTAQPTSTPTGDVTATLSPSDMFLGESDDYAFEITISNDSPATINPDILVSFSTNVLTDVGGTSATDWDSDFYPNDGNCEVIYFSKEEIGNIPSGGSKSLMLYVSLSVAEEVYWTPSISLE